MTLRNNVLEHLFFVQCHSLPQNSNKIFKNFLKSFSCTAHKIVLILFLNFEQSLSSCTHTVKKVLIQTSFCAFTTVKLIFFDILRRKPQRRDQNIRCHVQFV